MMTLSSQLSITEVRYKTCITANSSSHMTVFSFSWFKTIVTLISLGFGLLIWLTSHFNIESMR